MARDAGARPEQARRPDRHLRDYGPDADAAWQRAVDAGAKPDRPVKEEFWGDRMGTVVDPFGHKWTLGTHVRDVSPEEMQKAMAEWCPEGKKETA